MPSVSSAYWILSAMTAQIYLVMYILMFIAAIRLRYTKPHVPRSYKIPFPHKGMWLAACVGILASLFALFIAFVPPTQLAIGSIVFYEAFLIGGFVFMILLPLVIYQFRKPHWLKRSLEE